MIMAYHNISSRNNNDKNGSRHRYYSFLFISSMTTAVVLLSILSNASKVGAIATGTTSSSSSRGQPQKIRTTQPRRRVRGSSNRVINQRRTIARKINSIPAADGSSYRIGEASGMLPDDLWFFADNENENYNAQNQNQKLNPKYHQKTPKLDKTNGFFGKENNEDETATTAAAGEDSASNGADNDSSSNPNNNNNKLEKSNDINGEDETQTQTEEALPPPNDDNDSIAEEVVVDPSSTSSTTTNDLVCTAVESQKQQSLSEDDNEVVTTTTTSTTVFSVNVSVAYHTDKVTETMIETYLDVLNIPVALWISGCEEIAKTKLGYQQQQVQQLAVAEEDVAIAKAIIDADPSVRRRKRNLLVQKEEGGITANTIVAYSEVESWKNNGSCDNVDNSSLATSSWTSSSGVLCQKKFTSRVRIVSIGNNSPGNDDDDLRNQIIDAFNIFMQSLVEDQLGVIGVELLDDEMRVVNKEENEEDDGEEIVQLEIDESNSSNSNSNTENDEDSLKVRRTTIIACSIIAVGFLMSILLIGLIFIYKRRQKRIDHMPYFSYASTRRHVPFEDETDIDEGIAFANDDDKDLTKNMINDDDLDLDSDDDGDIPPPPPPAPTGDSDTSSEDFIDSDDDVFKDEDNNNIAVSFEGERPSEEALFLTNDAELFRLNHPFIDESNNDEQQKRLHVCSAATCQYCEQRRRLGVINPPKAPAAFINVTPMMMVRSPSSITEPRILRNPLTAAASERQYALGDFMDL